MRQNISVCMATYNGANYIGVQLDSILRQLLPGDELIIVDDTSKDETVSIIESYRSENIKLYQNEKNLGHVGTFEKALSLATKDYICFSDQDDEWIEGRIEKLLTTIIDKDICLVSSNYELNNQSNHSKVFQRLVTADSSNYFSNIANIFLGKAPYYGCTMMIKKEFKKVILPIPSYIEAHDLWMAMAANMLGSNYHLESNTLFYRIHDNNTSLKKRSLAQKIKTRFFFFKAIFNLFLRKVIFQNIK